MMVGDPIHAQNHIVFLSAVEALSDEHGKIAFELLTDNELLDLVDPDTHACIIGGNQGSGVERKFPVRKSGYGRSGTTYQFRRHTPHPIRQFARMPDPP